MKLWLARWKIAVQHGRQRCGGIPYLTTDMRKKMSQPPFNSILRSTNKIDEVTFVIALIAANLKSWFSHPSQIHALFKDIMRLPHVCYKGLIREFNPSKLRRERITRASSEKYSNKQNTIRAVRNSEWREKSAFTTVVVPGSCRSSLALQLKTGIEYKLSPVCI